MTRQRGARRAESFDRHTPIEGQLALFGTDSPADPSAGEPAAVPEQTARDRSETAPSGQQGEARPRC
ncbi:hypothetical protein L3Q65_00050 (plasmid) [Amycolatopsis sp. FU40]|uniref:hypothetical protein n=1 Tax=Amycolatopsis sp. FU40 TaxID=2914159 RepID=UPI001F16F0FD|nr:hypothetical protein [Amycolatopsis sp. FU40]UKD50751.1 hypothetical protein L3Q65_00050 [Amycolatopsis sp. FU40]